MYCNVTLQNCEFGWHLFLVTSAASLQCESIKNVNVGSGKMFLTWMLVSTFISLPSKPFATNLKSIDLLNHDHTYIHQEKGISRFLGEVEEAYTQNNCGQVTPSSGNIHVLERSVFSLEHSVSMFLAEVLREAKKTSYSKRFVEILAKEFLHYQDNVAFVVLFAGSHETAKSQTHLKVLKSSNRMQHTNIKEPGEAVEVLSEDLEKKCDSEKTGRGSSDILWTKPYSSCAGKVLVEAFYVAYTCNGSNGVHLRSYLELAIDLKKTDINQCDVGADDSNPFAGTNMCPDESICSPIKNFGLRDGGYTCSCRNGPKFAVNGSTILERGTNYIRACKGCSKETFCSDSFVLPDAITVAGLSTHIIVMIAMLLPGLLVAKLRKTKTLSFNFWQLYEVMLCGGFLIYLSVVVDYTEVSKVTCILGQWLREIGFVVLYSSMMLKIYRMRVECRSRQAQRVLLRDKDLIRYLVVILLLVTWQMLSWTVINVEHVHGGDVPGESSAEALCRVATWHYVVEIEEFLVLVCFVYLCCSVSAPPSFATECRAITLALTNEALSSTAYNAIRHFLMPSLTHRGNFLLSVVRCHITVTINLIVLIGIKLWQARNSSHVVSSCRRKEGSSVNAKEGVKSSGHRPLKAQSSKKTQDNKDSNDMNLSGLNPEDVKAELRRLYKQLEIYKAKSSRKDACHNAKKQTPRKQGPRRFSLYNFHHSRHSKHHATLADKSRCLDEGLEKDQSRITPEESTNSCEVWNLMSALP